MSLSLRLGLVVVTLLALYGSSPVGHAQEFIRGDANGDELLDLSDPIIILDRLFVSVLPFECEDAADFNDDEDLALDDPILLLDYLFAGGAPPPPPFPDCGSDVTGNDDLDCTTYAGCQGLTPGTLDVDWIHGSANCATNMDPELQIHQYNDDTFILRQNMCINFEGPFLYLLFGGDKVILFDTGTSANPAVVPTYDTVQGIIDQWLIDNNQASIDLIVAHTHSHGDHIAGDPQFIGQPDTTVVGTSLSAVTDFFGIIDWPEEIVCYDLGGGRALDIIPTPGHESRHISIYDRDTGILIAGDSLYPGFLFVAGQANWDTFKESVERMVDFSLSNPIAWVLGCHIEMTDQAGVAYPYGTNYQPEEHVLELELMHLIELHEALQMLPNPVQEVHDDFIITGF